MILKSSLCLFVAAQLLAQQAPELGTAWTSVTAEAFVDIQIQDAQGRISGMDFGTGHPRRELPNSIYEPYEGISDDESGEPDPNPVQELEFEISAPGDYILRLRSSKKTMASVGIDFSDRHWHSVRRKVQIQPGQIAQILEYRVHVDPLAASACNLRAMVRQKP